MPELLGGLLPLEAGAGLAVEWRVLFGDPELRRVAGALQPGCAAGRAPSATRDWAACTAACERIAAEPRRHDDLVVLHDPGALGLAPGLERAPWSGTAT